MPFQHSIAGGQGNLINGSFQSPGFVTGLTGWQVTRAGHFEANDAVIRGTINAGTFAGTDFIINAAGAFFYSGAPAAGNLIASIAPVAGTDSFGNAYKANIATYGTGGSTSYVQLAPGNPANVIVATGDANEQTPGNISAIISGAGASRLLVTRVKSPVVSTFPNGTARMDLFAAAVDNSGPAECHIQVIDAGGVTAAHIFVTPTQIHLASAPSLIDNIQSAGGITGKLPVQQTDTTEITATAAAATTITNNWTVPANDAQAGTIYQLTCGGFGVQAAGAAVGLTIDAREFGQVFASSVLNAATIPAGATFHWEFTVRIIVVSTGVTGTARASGVFTWSQATTTGSRETVAAGQTSAVDTTVNTTTATSIRATATWASVTGAPTMTCMYSIFERLGP